MKRIMIISYVRSELILLIIVIVSSSHLNAKHASCMLEGRALGQCAGPGPCVLWSWYSTLILQLSDFVIIS